MTTKTFEVATDDLSRAVRWAAKITQGTSEGSLISVKIAESVMLMESYNGINASKSKTDITQKFEGELKFSIVGSMFATAIKAIKDKQITLSVDGRTLTVKTSKQKFSLPITMPRNQLILPKMPAPIGTVDSTDFRMFVNHATSMVSDDTSTPALTVVHINVSPQNSELTLVATDRYKLVTRTISYTPTDAAAATAGTTADYALNVDAKSLKSMFAELADADTLTLYADADNPNGQLGISTADQIGIVLQKDVTYPNYKKLTALTPAYIVVVKRAELVSAISTTKPMIQGAVKVADIVIAGADFTLSTPMTSIDVDIQKTTLEEDMTIHVNLDYMTPVLSSGKSEFVGLGISAAKKPLVVQEMTDVDTINENYFTLVMPISS